MSQSQYSQTTYSNLEKETYQPITTFPCLRAINFSTGFLFVTANVGNERQTVTME